MACVNPFFCTLDPYIYKLIHTHMFILRRISSDGVQMNRAIGDGYTIVGRMENFDEFRRIFKQHFHKKHIADLDPTSDDDTKNVHYFICFDGNLQPIYKNQKNYIMTESGKTFAKI